MVSCVAVGCTRTATPALSAAPVTQGIFMVTSQSGQQPVVEIQNDSDTSLRLLMNSSDGKVFSLDVGARSDGDIEVPTGHYEAKVYDVAGHISSAFGDADITQYKRYTASFHVEPQGGQRFHIGG